MSDVIDDTSKTNTNQDGSTDTNSEQNTQKTFTQEDFDKQLSKTLADKESKLEKRMQERFEKDTAERERLAKLSSEEKDVEERKKRDEQTSTREREIILRENRADARELLQEKNISSDLVDFVVDVDADKTKANIDNLEKAFLKAVEAGVNERLKGVTPADKTKQAETPKHSGTTVI